MLTAGLCCLQVAKKFVAGFGSLAALKPSESLCAVVPVAAYRGCWARWGRCASWPGGTTSCTAWRCWLRCWACSSWACFSSLCPQSSATSFSTPLDEDIETPPLCVRFVSHKNWCMSYWWWKSIVSAIFSSRTVEIKSANHVDLILNKYSITNSLSNTTFAYCSSSFDSKLSVNQRISSFVLTYQRIMVVRWMTLDANSSLPYFLSYIFGQ